MNFDKETKEKIAKAIQEKGALMPCQRCGKTNFSVLDGFVSVPLAQQIYGGIVIGGPQVPTAVIVCDNCGNLNYHAIGALGLSNEQKKGG